MIALALCLIFPDKAIEFGVEHEALNVDGVCVDEENKLGKLNSAQSCLSNQYRYVLRYIFLFLSLLSHNPSLYV